jgi:hypothetical protein
MTSRTTARPRFLKNQIRTLPLFASLVFSPYYPSSRTSADTLEPFLNQRQQAKKFMEQGWSRSRGSGGSPGVPPLISRQRRVPHPFRVLCEKDGKPRTLTHWAIAYSGARPILGRRINFAPTRLQIITIRQRTMILCPDSAQSISVAVAPAQSARDVPSPYRTKNTHPSPSFAPTP